MPLNSEKDQISIWTFQIFLATEILRGILDIANTSFQLIHSSTFIGWKNRGKKIFFQKMAKEKNKLSLTN